MNADDELDNIDKIASTVYNWNMATWNVTSFTDKDIEAIEEMERYGVVLLGLSETKIKGRGIRSLEN